MLELNLIGLNCPLPVLKTKKLLATVNGGIKIKLITTSPDAAIDLATFCTKTGHKLIKQNNIDGITYTIIEHR